MPTNGPLITINDVVEAIHFRLPQLARNTPYTLEQLAGKKRWLATPSGHRKQLGHHFRVLEAKGYLPVRWFDRRSDNAQRYQLK